MHGGSPCAHRVWVCRPDFWFVRCLCVDVCSFLLVTRRFWIDSMPVCSGSVPVSWIAVQRRGVGVVRGRVRGGRRGCLSRFLIHQKQTKTSTCARTPYLALLNTYQTYKTSFTQ